MQTHLRFCTFLLLAYAPRRSPPQTNSSVGLRIHQRTLIRASHCRQCSCWYCSIYQWIQFHLRYFSYFTHFTHFIHFIHFDRSSYSSSCSCFSPHSPIAAHIRVFRASASCSSNQVRCSFKYYFDYFCYFTSSILTRSSVDSTKSRISEKYVQNSHSNVSWGLNVCWGLSVCWDSNVSWGSKPLGFHSRAQASVEENFETSAPPSSLLRL